MKDHSSSEKKDMPTRNGDAIASVNVMSALVSIEPLGEGERTPGIAQLVSQVEALVKASGNDGEFDARKWIDRWLEQSNPALGGQRPGRYMNTAEGRAIVSNLIALGAGGGFA
jgi:hypothetical protein